MLDFRVVYSGEMLVFGHRGAKAYAPMNTLPAFELALAQGAHGIELDVHRSRDGHPVVCHDFTVDATSNGTGVVTQMTLAELKALDAGSWFSSAFAGAQIPTLDEVFEAVGHKLIVNVEIKSMDAAQTDGVEEVVADCIRRHGMTDRVIVSSFNPYTLIRFRKIAPEVAIGFLHMAAAAMPTADVMADQPYEAFHPYYQDVTPKLVAQTHAAGRVVNTWTVNDPADALRLRDWGVDCVITDNPDVILQALRS